MSRSTDSAARQASKIGTAAKTCRWMIVNAYSHRNVGDAAIVIATANLARMFGASSITNASRYLDDDREFYENHGIDVAKPLVKFPVRNASGELGRAFALAHSSVFVLLKIMIYGGLRRLTPWNPVARQFREVDVVALCGGGYFYSAQRRLNLTFFHALLQSLYACAAGPRVVMIPQSIGPLKSRWERRLIALLLRSLDEVACRESYSHALCREIAPMANVSLVPDVAFLGADERREVFDVQDQSKIAEIVAMDWTWARNVKDDESLRAYVSALAAVGRRLQAGGFEVRVTGSSSVSEHDQDDWKVADQICRKIGDGAMLGVPPNGPIDQADEFGSSDVVIATRMHSAILALTRGAPTIGLAYQAKTTGTYELIGLEDWCRDVETFDPDEVASLASEIARNPEARRRAIGAARSASFRLETYFARLLDAE